MRGTLLNTHGMFSCPLCFGVVRFDVQPKGELQYATGVMAECRSSCPNKGRGFRYEIPSVPIEWIDEPQPPTAG